MLPKSFKQKCKLNPVSRARRRGKRGKKSSVKSIVCQFAAFETKVEPMVRTLKLELTGARCNIFKLQYKEVVGL